MEKKLKIVSLRVGADMLKRMKSYCMEKGVASSSELLRFALTRVLVPDIEEKELVFESLQQLHGKLHKVYEQQDIMFQFLCFFMRNWFAYHGDIEAANMESAKISAKQRYESFFKGFKKTLKDTSLLQSIAADLFEEAP